MAGAGRGKTRRDAKRRVLRPSESVRADGKYQYKYHIDGKPHFVYSWKLETTYKLLPGKKPCLSLWELEKQVNSDLDRLMNASDGQMTVCELVDRYLIKTQNGRTAEYKSRLCGGAESFGKGTIRTKEDQKHKDFGCKVVFDQAATGGWQGVQFHSHHTRGIKTCLSDGGG